MSDEEKVFKELCDYVKTEIMGYDENQALTKNMILRLRGMKTGQYMANKSSTVNANYPFKIILLTFQYLKQHELLNIVKTKNFNSEQHKFNYIMKIAENNINLIYNKAKQLQEQRRKSENIKVNELPNYENKYKKHEVETINKDMEQFW